MPVTEITRLDRETSRWDEAFYAFLAEKERRNGSLRTVALSAQGRCPEGDAGAV